MLTFITKLNSSPTLFKSSLLARATAVIPPNLKYKLSEGILIDYKNGYALIKPLKKGNGFKILAESSKAEFANEICNDISKFIEESKN